MYDIDTLYFLRRIAYAHCLDFAGASCLELLRGTAYLPMVFDLLGAQIGSRVHLATLAITEPDLCEIGSGSSVDAGAILFGHSLDRGRFSQGALKIGRSCALDNHALLVHGTNLGKQTHLTPSSATLPNSKIPGYGT